MNPSLSQREFLAVQLSLSFLINFLFGSVFSAPLFTVPITDAAKPPHSLDNIWPLSTAACFPLTAFLMIPLAIYFDNASSKTKAARRLSFLSTVALILVSLGAMGIIINNRVLLFIGGVILAVPLAANTVFNVQHVAELVPNNFGFAVGICNVAIGFGLAITSWFGHLLVSKFPTSTSLFIFSITLAIIGAVPVLSVVFPEERNQKTSLELEQEPEDDPLLQPQLSQSFIQLSWREAIRNRSVWWFVLCIACKRICFPILPYFFEIGNTYGASTGTLVRWVQIGAVLSVVFNFITSSASDYFKTRSGMFSCGGRNVTLFIIALQSVALAALCWMSPSRSNFFSWSIATTTVRVALQSHFGMAVLIANDFFGPKNMALISGFAGGLAIGFGEAIATVAMSGIAQKGTRLDPAIFLVFYKLALIVSILSFVFLCFIRRQI